ncbi:unnamed protein product, partial [Musa acuminata subsp. malaccensis]
NYPQRFRSKQSCAKREYPLKSRAKHLTYRSILE